MVSSIVDSTPASAATRVSDIVMMDAVALAGAIRSRQVSCVEVMTRLSRPHREAQSQSQRHRRAAGPRGPDGAGARARRPAGARRGDGAAARLSPCGEGLDAGQGHADDPGLADPQGFRAARRQRAWWSACARPAPSSSARPTRRNSAWARTPTIRSMAPPTIPMTSPARPAAAAAARRWRWRCACCRWPTAAIMAAACAIPPAGTMCSAFAPASAACRPTGAMSGCRRWASAGRWPATSPIWRCCCRCRPATMRARRCRFAGDGAVFRGRAGDRPQRQAHRLGRRLSADMCRTNPACSMSARRR